MEERWGFTFDESIKYDLLGLGFMKEDRGVSPELSDDDLEKRMEISVSEEDSIKLTEYLKGKKPEMVDLYNALYHELKERIPDLYEIATQPYIAWRNEIGKNIAEVRIQASQIKIVTSEPLLDENKIGEHLPDSYRWSKTYCIYMKKIDEVRKVANAIFDAYEQII